MSTISCRDVIITLKRHFCRCGIFKCLISDCGRQFVSDVFVINGPFFTLHHLRAINKVMAVKAFTRRGLLSMVSSIFDPLGFVAPILTAPKLWLRELKEQDWDEEISEMNNDVGRNGWLRWRS